MKAKDLIRNNSLTNIEITGGQTVVFTEIALTAIDMAREEGRQEMKEKAINALFQSTIAFPNDTDIKAFEKQKEIFIEKVNS